MRANDLHQFTFKKEAFGAYRVTFTTESRGDYWSARIEDMTLIDATLHAEYAKKADIIALRDAVKAKGIHRNANGEPM